MKKTSGSYNPNLGSTVPTPSLRGTFVGALSSLPAAPAAFVCGTGIGRGRCRRRGGSRSRRGGTGFRRGGSRISVRAGIGDGVLVVGVGISSLSDGEIFAIILCTTLSNGHLQRRVIRIRNHRAHTVKPSR